MDDDLPLDYDLVVIGTGMTESIVAAAASRIGKKTLHIDSTDYYGGMWASFNFDGLQKILIKFRHDSESRQFTLKNIDEEWFIPESISDNIETTEVSDPRLQNNKETDGCDEAEVQESAEIGNETSKESLKDLPNEKSSGNDEQPKKVTKRVWTVESVKKEYRKFNIDLAPKLLYARGALVELLKTSNIARYAEFRCINRVMTWMNEEPIPVPCSRADVFAAAEVSVVEKRMLMKLLTSFVNYDEDSLSEEFIEYADTTFINYLKSKKLTNNLVHYVLYAIAGATEATNCMEGIRRCRRFLISLGRYGNTPFLWPMYGSGELPQCFCRLCAVFGGVYCLNRPIGAIHVGNGANGVGRLISIESKGKTLSCDNLVIAVDKVPDEYITKCDTNVAGLSRAIFITDSSILEFEKESLTLLQFPPMEGSKDPVTVIEVGPSTGSCPEGLYIVHMICAQSRSAKEDILLYARKLMTFVVEPSATHNENRKKPKVLWSLYFNIPDTSHADMFKSKDEHIHICSGPDADLDFEFAVKQGYDIFNKIYPGEEFLPRAPDPEEILFDGDDETGPEFQKDEESTANEEVTEEANQINKENSPFETSTSIY